MQAAPSADRRGGTYDLPPPVSGQRRDIDSGVGRLALYSAGPATASALPPLLLIHSINAAGSAYEVRPLYEHYRQSRKVYALELPGFGHSSRDEREYTVRLMTDAIHTAVREIAKENGGAPIDALALSLSSEFLARAVSENREAFRSAALISPTGLSARDLATTQRHGSRAMPWLHGLLERRLWSGGFWRLLTSRASIRFFLQKTWGSRAIDEGLLNYDYVATHQPGARHAPYYFVSGYLFSKDILDIYQGLTLPVWMCHGVRGDFIDYTAKTKVESRPNWTIRIFQTGALPQFEMLTQVVASYDAFLAGLPASA